LKVTRDSNDAVVIEVSLMTATALSELLCFINADADSELRELANALAHLEIVSDTQLELDFDYLEDVYELFPKEELL